MLSFLRGAYGRALTPVAVLLLRLGVSPSQVTVTGTVAVVAAAMWFFPRGELASGVGVIGLFLLADGLDGTMARHGGRVSAFGAFLDSTLDRVADGAVFAGLVIWAAGRDAAVVVWLGLACLVTGFVVSYSRARAESEGWDASVGLFERADRLAVAGAATLAVGLGAPEWILSTGLAIVAVGSAVTVVQRIRAAWRASQVGVRRG